ncbi:uncharacterized protein LOC141685916 [Apium graveolens]|uniref:uncharacterized protein LOC141685916 n=1 Tax=Apium graveolens TaxID=4045 RepID=UPI003D7B6CF5
MHEANVWLLEKLEVAPQSEILKVCTVLHGIWDCRNKQVWEGKVVPGRVAMDCSIKMLQDWKKAKARGATVEVSHNPYIACNLRNWKAPEDGEYKVNVDDSWFQGADSFSIAIVLGNYCGTFVEGRTVALLQAMDVLEDEALGIREALSWVKNMEERKVTVESDSLVAVNAINGQNNFLLEVGHIIDHCKIMLQ